MKKNLIVTAALLLGTFTFAQTENSTANPVERKTTISKKAILTEGTLVKVALKNEIRGGKMQIGTQIEFTLAQPIIVGNEVVVNKGSKILGTVSDARASGILGRKGKLAFTIDYLYLDNGQIVKLTGHNAKNLKGSEAIVGATTILVTPLGLLIPGKGAKYEAGTVFDAYIAKDTELN